MKHGIFVCAVSLLVVTAGCSKKNEAANCKFLSDIKSMNALKLQDAENDARRDNNNGDHRLLGIESGIGLQVPGLVGNPDTSGYGLKIIEGTEIPCDASEHQLNMTALQYAKEYNQQKMLLWQPLAH